MQIVTEHTSHVAVASPSQRRPFVLAGRYDANLPTNVDTSAAPLLPSTGSDLFQVGTLRGPLGTGKVGWLGGARQLVGTSFMQALGAARDMAKQRMQVGSGNHTTVAAVLQGESGAYYVAPMFGSSGTGTLLSGVRLDRTSSFRPAANGDLVAVAGTGSWIDLRPSSLDA